MAELMSYYNVSTLAKVLAIYPIAAHSRATPHQLDLLNTLGFKGGIRSSVETNKFLKSYIDSCKDMDLTGTQSVRQWAEQIASSAAAINEACGHDRHKPCAEMTFVHEGVLYTIEATVKKAEPI